MADPAAPSPDAVELTVDGALFGGWTSVSIDVGLDAIASAFSLQVTERWPGQPDKWEIEAGTEAKVTIGGELVMTGFVDRLEASLDGSSHGITVSGRSKAGDLVDCSAVALPGSWSGKTIEAIAGELAAPFGIAIAAEASTAPPLRKFALQQGETVWEAIERMLRMRGLIAWSKPDGAIAIVSPKPAGAAIRIAQGTHDVTLSASHDVTERFARYIVKGQSAGDDHVNGKAAAGPKAEASDPAVTRYRPLIVIAEDQADLATCRKRAAWEATVRAAKAQEATLTLPGWRQPGGKSLWQPLQLVDLDAPAAWIAAPMLVAGVGFRLDGSGRRTELRLAFPEAYSQQPVPAEAKASHIRHRRKTA